MADGALNMSEAIIDRLLLEPRDVGLNSIDHPILERAFQSYVNRSIISNPRSVNMIIFCIQSSPSDLLLEGLCWVGCSVRIALENSSNTLHTSALYLAFGTCFPVRRTTQAMPANKFHDKMYAVYCYYIRGL